MMSFLDELKKNVSDITETVAKKSSVVIENQKLKVNKMGLKMDLVDAYEALGRIYEKELLAREGETFSEEVTELLEEIAAAKKAIEAIDETLKK